MGPQWLANPSDLQSFWPWVQTEVNIAIADLPGSSSFPTPLLIRLPRDVAAHAASKIMVRKTTCKLLAPGGQAGSIASDGAEETRDSMASSSVMSTSGSVEETLQIGVMFQDLTEKRAP